MTSTRKPTPAEILAAIEEPSPDEGPSPREEMDRVLAMTPEQRRAELEAAGFDLNELHAEADAWHETMKQTAVEERKKELVSTARAASGRPPARRRRPLVLLLAATLGAAAIGGAAYAYVHWAERPRSPAPAPSAPPSVAPEPPWSSQPIAERAARYRERGLAECSGHMWQPCVEDLDTASELDPAGESDPAVKAAREEAAKWFTPDEPLKPKGR